MCEDWTVECPCCSVFLNLFTVVIFIVTVICATDDTTYNGFISPRDLFYLPLVSFLLIYIVYLVECYFASTRRYLRDILQGKTIQDYISEVRSASPAIRLKATGWHHESKSRAVCYTDARGKRKWRDENYQDRIVTGSENELFSFSKWKDKTSVPDEIKESTIAVLVCSKSFTFANEYSKQMFTNQSCAFQARNRHRDTRMDYEEVLEIDGFLEKVLAFTDLKKKSWWMEAGWYWICSVCLCSWPYRVMLKRHCCFISLEFVKKLEVSPV